MFLLLKLVGPQSLVSSSEQKKVDSWTLSIEYACMLIIKEGGANNTQCKMVHSEAVNTSKYVDIAISLALTWFHLLGGAGGKLPPQKF